MAVSIEVTIDTVDPQASAAFWQQALGYELVYVREPYTVLVPPEGDVRPRLVLQRVPAVTPGKTPVHLDLRVDDPEAEVARLKALGATVEWVIEETWTRWTTMSDPFGVLFCVASAR
jgi:predicted enzyme related to lactoylglutathione lyase